jgi:threonine dehydrogenase-like Zn-dependent dehydrogenase
LGAVACGNLLGAHVTAISDQSKARDKARDYSANAFERQMVSSLKSYDFIISTTNSWRDWRIVLEMASVGAKIGVLGFPGRGEPVPDFNPLDSRWLYEKRLTLKAVGPPDSLERLRENMKLLLGWIGSRKLDVRALTEVGVSWRDLGTFYETLDCDRGNITTAILDWR